MHYWSYLLSRVELELPVAFPLEFYPILPPVIIHSYQRMYGPRNPIGENRSPSTSSLSVYIVSPIFGELVGPCRSHEPADQELSQALLHAFLIIVLHIVLTYHIPENEEESWKEDEDINPFLTPFGKVHSSTLTPRYGLNCSL